MVVGRKWEIDGWEVCVRVTFEIRRVGNYVRILRYCCTGIKSGIVFRDETRGISMIARRHDRRKRICKQRQRWKSAIEKLSLERKTRLIDAAPSLDFSRLFLFRYRPTGEINPR